MPKLDHITVISPTLAEGVSHVRHCLGIDVPFGTRHHYMGTHNHRLQLGDNVYLEIVACDPEGAEPGRARWFGLDSPAKVRSDWDSGRRLRGWVALVEGSVLVWLEAGRVPAHAELRDWLVEQLFAMLGVTVARDPDAQFSTTPSALGTSR